jgi:hypothetical protein
MLTAPCSLNIEPYLTEWHADLESGMEIWIQTSEDESNPKWERLGNILERIWRSTEEMGLFASENWFDLKQLDIELKSEKQNKSN